MGFWPIVHNAIKNADVILLIADARIPHTARNEEILRKAALKEKEVFIVYNKTDLLPKRRLAALEQNEEAYCISAKKRNGIKKLRNALEKRAKQNTKTSLRVALLGYPNAGKSTLLNILAPRAQAAVSARSGTTKQTQWARTNKIRYIDTPGVIPFKTKEAAIALLSAKDPHKLQHPEKAAATLTEFLLKKYPGTLEKTYGVSETTVYEILQAIGKKKRYLHKKNEVDEHRTAIQLLHDWQQEKILLE